MVVFVDGCGWVLTAGLGFFGFGVWFDCFSGFPVCF